MTFDKSKSANKWQQLTGIGKYSVLRHLRHQDEVKVPGSAVAIKGVEPAEESGITTTGEKYFSINRKYAATLDDWREWVEHSGDDPENFIPSIRSIAYAGDMYSNRLGMTPKWKGLDNGAPKWPVIQQAEPVWIAPEPARVNSIHVDGEYKVAIKCADTQIGFRNLPDGTLDPFHDQAAMHVFIEVCALYQPDKIQILGDFLDLASQGRFAQEASFANTTQKAINEGHFFLARLRHVCPNSEIILIEGNHDLRMQHFIEANALAAFGLKQANMPEAWPVMSLPFLLRLEELDVKYIDSYPAATDWDNDLTRNIHGTKANSKGSTMAQYVHELPHVNTWAGHTHRLEVVYRTVLGARGKAVESYAANPGVLCRVDGSVPSVKGAVGASGIAAKVVEDWQQGFGILYYNEVESWPQVYRIRDGKAILGDRVVSGSSLRDLRLAA